MRTRPFAGEAPFAAQFVWLALDPREVRSYGRVANSLRSTRLAQAERTWKKKAAPALAIERTHRLARKWADVTTSRGLAWLLRQGWIVKVGKGYLRRPRGSPTGGDPFLATMWEAEQRLRNLRVIWENNPRFPEKSASEEVRKKWVGEYQTLFQQLGDVLKGLEERLPALPGPEP